MTRVRVRRAELDVSWRIRAQPEGTTRIGLGLSPWAENGQFTARHSKDRWPREAYSSLLGNGSSVGLRFVGDRFRTRRMIPVGRRLPVRLWASELRFPIQNSASVFKASNSGLFAHRWSSLARAEDGDHGLIQVRVRGRRFSLPWERGRHWRWYRVLELLSKSLLGLSILLPSSFGALSLLFR